MTSELPVEPPRRDDLSVAGGKAKVLHLVGRHQLASVAATIVDFGFMTASVELFGLSPVLATIGGACLGAFANFELGRHWVYKAANHAVAGQALRYAIASGVSAGLNGAGEALLLRTLGWNYLVVRLVVATAVSFGWNLPVQRFWVFGRSASGAYPSRDASTTR